MTHPLRRFIFIDYDNLRKVKFKKIEKVCDKVFILIDNRVEQVPLELVRQTQKLGKAVKWIPVELPEGETNLEYHLAFYLGKMHEKTPLDIEFALLTNEESYDGLIAFINAEGRSCLRVQRKKETELIPAETEVSDNGQEGIEDEAPVRTRERVAEAVVSKASSGPASEPAAADDFSERLIEETARKTIDRLIRSGNRPAEISMLKNYILLHNQELTRNGANLDRIIQRMVASQSIRIEGGDVKYNF